MEPGIPVFVPKPSASPCKFLRWQDGRAAFWTLPGPDEKIHAVEWDDSKQSWVERPIDWDEWEVWKAVPTGWLQCGRQFKEFTFYQRLNQAVAIFKVAQGLPYNDGKLCQHFSVGIHQDGWFTEFMPNTWSEPSKKKGGSPGDG